MASDAPPGHVPAPVARPSPRRRAIRFALLVAGLAFFAFMAKKAPHAQALHLVLGDAARDVGAIELSYVAEDGDVVRTTRLGFEPGQAPRIVTVEPSLADETYRLRIEVHTRQGVREIERRVTLSGGGTSVDLAAVLSRAP